MATQFVLNNTARIQAHLTITIETKLDSYSNNGFDVSIDCYGMLIPEEITKLLSINLNQNITGGKGIVKRRIFSSDIQSFLKSFEVFCNGNITNKQIEYDRVIYTYESKVGLGVFDYNSYQQDEVTIQFDDEEIIFYIDGKDIPQAFLEIMSTLGKEEVIAKKAKINNRKYTYSINTGYYDIKELVKQFIQYLGQNGYKIVNVNDKLFCIDLRYDSTQEEVISVQNYLSFVDTIVFEQEPELTLNDLISSLAGIVTGLLPEEVLEVEAIDV